MLHLFIDSTNCAVTATCHPRNKLVAIWTSTPWRSQHLSENSPRLCLAWNRPVTPLLQQVCMCQGNLWIRKIRNIQYVIYSASWWMHEITENRRCPIHMRREGVSMTFKHVWNPFQTVSNTSAWTFQTRETCFMAFEKKKHVFACSTCITVTSLVSIQTLAKRQGSCTGLVLHETCQKNNLIRLIPVLVQTIPGAEPKQ